MGNHNGKKVDNENYVTPYFDNKVHGENISISEDRRHAKRIRSYCKGICFTSRPIYLNEPVCIRILETSSNWSGGLRLGVTAIDPLMNSKSLEICNKISNNSNTQIILPKYAVSKLGYWIKSLSSKYMEANNCIVFYIDNHGNVPYSINGELKGNLMTKLPFKNDGIKFWGIFDIYGNTISLEILNPFNLYPNMKLTKNLLHQNVSNGNIIIQNNLELDFQDSHINSPAVEFEIRNNITSLTPVSSGISKYYKQAADSLDPLHFNPRGFSPGIIGKHVKLNFTNYTSTTSHTNSISAKQILSDKIVDQKLFNLATRLPNEFCNAYVFTARPLDINEKVIVKILATDAYVGSLAFGLTSCDPTTLSSQALPDDADFLVDRKEYWVVIKDIANVSPAASSRATETKLQAGDEIGVYINDRGQVMMELNAVPTGSLLYVDISQPLWAFWDLYGAIKKIHLIGSYYVTLNIEELHSYKNNTVSANSLQQSILSPSLSTTLQTSPSSGETFADNSTNSMSILTPDLSRDILALAGYTPPQSNNNNNDHSNNNNRNCNNSRRDNLYCPTYITNHSNQCPSLLPQDLYKLSPRANTTDASSQIRNCSVPETPIATIDNGIFNIPNPLIVGPCVSRHGNPNSVITSRRPLRNVPNNSNNSNDQSHWHQNGMLENNQTFTNPLRTETTTEIDNFGIDNSISFALPSPDNVRRSPRKRANHKLETVAKDNTNSASSTTATITTNLSPLIDKRQECVVCYDTGIDCILYPCGHACMCYPCAQITCAKEVPQNSQSPSLASSSGQSNKFPCFGLCPICRKDIKDIVKIYLP